MKISCLRDELIKKLNIVMKAVPAKTTLNIQQCILIRADFDSITFTANDLELAIETRVEGIVDGQGTAALDARLFSEIIKKMPDSLVTIDIDTDKPSSAAIFCEKTFFQIPWRDGDEFSDIPEVEKENPVVLSQYALRNMILQTIFSISPNDSNIMMTGELMEITENTMRVVSLDGHRISVRMLDLIDHYGDRKVIVPGKSLLELSRILTGEVTDQVYVYMAKNHVLFELDGTIVVSRLIDGNYFRIDHMLSTDYETKITVNRKDLANSIDRSLLFVREEDRKPIVLDIGQEEMELRISSQIGSFDETIQIQKEGNDLKIGFNPKYLNDALRVIDEDMVDIYFMNSKSPCFIRDQKGSYIYLILPVNFV